MVTTSPIAATAEHPPLNSLFSDLSSDDGWVRQQARRALVRQGAGAVPQLINALLAPDERTRLETAKVLRQIADPRAASALVLALEDSDSGVRWIAMDALIALRHSGLRPLLYNLVGRSDSTLLRAGAHRVIRELMGHPTLQPILMPVLQALEAVEPIVTVPGAAQTALEQLNEESTAPAGPVATRYLLVNDWMTPHPFTIEPRTALSDAYHLMQAHRIRHLPVVSQGRLVGIVSLGDVREAKPSDATTLSIYEVNYRWATLTVDQIMTTSVIIVTPQTTLVSAAQSLLTRKIGALPVIEKGHVVGMLTESDIFRAFIEEEMALWRS